MHIYAYGLDGRGGGACSVAQSCHTLCYTMN